MPQTFTSRSDHPQVLSILPVGNTGEEIALPLPVGPCMERNGMCHLIGTQGRAKAGISLSNCSGDGERYGVVAISLSRRAFQRYGGMERICALNTRVRANCNVSLASGNYVFAARTGSINPYADGSRFWERQRSDSRGPLLIPGSSRRLHQLAGVIGEPADLVAQPNQQAQGVAWQQRPRRPGALRACFYARAAVAGFPLATRATPGSIASMNAPLAIRIPSIGRSAYSSRPTWSMRPSAAGFCEVLQPEQLESCGALKLKARRGH